MFLNPLTNPQEVFDEIRICPFSQLSRQWAVGGRIPALSLSQEAEGESGRDPGTCSDFSPGEEQCPFSLLHTDFPGFP